MQAEANIVERITQAYIANRGVRLICALAVLVTAPLLYMLAGGFPPSAWILLARALPQVPTLLAQKGPGVLLALAGLFLLAFTIFLIWVGLVWVSWKMLAYWHYERQEMLAFAAELEEAQSQASELEQPYTPEEEERRTLAPRSVGSSASRPAGRYKILYPPNALDADEGFSPERSSRTPEAPGLDAADEPFFVEEDEDETEMGIYRDDDEEEDDMNWNSHKGENGNTGASGARPVYVGATTLYDQHLAEQLASAYDQQFAARGALRVAAEYIEPTGAPSLPGESVQHSSYGRVLPFSAAPSAGALPHLTTTVYERVSMPHSVEQPSQRNVQTKPGQSRQATSSPRIEPTRAASPQGAPGPLAARPTAHLAEPQPAPQTKRPVPIAQGSYTIVPRPIAQPGPALPRPQAPRPAQLVTSLPAPERNSVQETKEDQPAAPAQGKGELKAMQSLLELISTVPLVPPAPSQMPVSPPSPQPLTRPELPRPLTRPEASPRRQATQLVVSTGLDVGLKRRGKPNEDSLLALQNTRVLRGSECPVGLFVVADGMGGHENGQEASHLVIQSLSKTVVPSIIYGPTDDNYSEMLAEGVHHANLEVYQRNRQGKVDMGTTIVAALIVDTTAYIVSAGDSRVYLYRASSGLIQVTRDHSTVARLVENGLIQPDEVYTHPRRNEIYRSLGHHPSEELDKFILALEPNDVLLLCSDGLWEMVRDDHIREIIASTAGQPTQTSAALIQAALDGGGKDNVSVVVVNVKAVAGAKPQTAWAV